MNFYKYQGLGNDFICINGFEPLPDLKRSARQLCDRHKGIGADGILILKMSQRADCSMEVINADGSSSTMCGNGLRCLAIFAKKLEIINKSSFSIETHKRINQVEILDENNPALVSVDLGEPDFDPRKISQINQSEFIFQDFKINNQTYKASLLSFGNPHLVLLVDNLKSLNLQELGPSLEADPRFLTGINVEFIELASDKLIKQRTWERGVGETQACGSGACAAAVSLIKAGLVKNPVEVELLGGRLKIDYQRSVKKIGAAQAVYSGSVDIADFN